MMRPLEVLEELIILEVYFKTEVGGGDKMNINTEMHDILCEPRQRVLSGAAC